MQLILQPNKWTCLPAAAATVLGTDLDSILHLVGHDGSRIIDPTLPDPECRAGFLEDEIIDVLFAFDVHPVTIHAMPCYDENIPGPLTSDRFYHHINRAHSILLGETVEGYFHAVAYNCEDQRIYNPCGMKQDIHDFIPHAAIICLNVGPTFTRKLF